MLEVSSTEIIFDNVDGNMKPFKLDIKNITPQFIGYKVINQKLTKKDKIYKTRYILSKANKRNIIITIKTSD